ncbi:hypothetical protein SDJN02_12341, partial [Cucurbita argyrosperma subsp. argyrosperma]
MNEYIEKSAEHPFQIQKNQAKSVGAYFDFVTEKHLGTQEISGGVMLRRLPDSYGEEQGKKGILMHSNLSS